jgi:thiol-disulfide isomerase/thioredoxin
MKFVLQFVFGLGALIATHVFANTPLMTAAQLAQIDSQGKSAVISVFADWCSTCKSQDKVLTGFMKDPQYKNVAFYQINFDTQKDLLKSLKVRTQSTIIVFKNGKEAVRSTGDTKESSIAKLTKQAI